MTWVTRLDHDGVHALELLVVWRGQPAWFMRGGPRSSSGGGSGSSFHSVDRFGEVELELGFDSATHVADIKGRRVNLGDSNVVLVDGVDGADGPRIVTHLHVDPALDVLSSDRPDIDGLILRSPEIASFLQCDVPMAYAGRSGFVWPTCARVRGQEPRGR